MVVFDSAYIYVSSATEICDKIDRLDAIITALEDVALIAAAKGDISEYSLDDGQTKIRTSYRDALEISKSITAFETIRMRYINRLNGRQVRLVDGSNFR